MRRLSKRDPMAVAVLSSTCAKVFSKPPDKLTVSSKFLRVAASNITACSLCSSVIARMWGSAIRCVSFTYCIKQPAATKAACALSTPKPTKSLVPNCSHSKC